LFPLVHSFPLVRLFQLVRFNLFVGQKSAASPPLEMAGLVRSKKVGGHGLSDPVKDIWPACPVKNSWPAGRSKAKTHLPLIPHFLVVVNSSELSDSIFLIQLSDSIFFIQLSDSIFSFFCTLFGIVFLRIPVEGVVVCPFHCSAEVAIRQILNLYGTGSEWSYNRHKRKVFRFILSSSLFFSLLLSSHLFSSLSFLLFFSSLRSHFIFSLIPSSHLLSSSLISSSISSSLISHLRYKLSGDGKVDSGQTQFMFGISPLDLDGVIVQSCYNVFPLALVCCEEETETLKEELAVLWKEVRELNKCGVLKGEGRKKHFFDFILTTDLKTFWQLFSIRGGHLAHCNCPYCEVRTPADRADMSERWTTWSRPTLVSITGISNDKFVFCTLHLILRCIEFFMQDVYDKVVKLKGEPKLSYLMTVEIGIAWKTYEGGKRKKGRRVRSFTGSQCKKILKNIEKIASLLDVKKKSSGKDLRVKDLGVKDLGVKVWKGFREMLQRVERGEVKEKCDGKECKSCAKCFAKEGMRWGSEFKAVHGCSTLRLYFHLLIHHAGTLSHLEQLPSVIPSPFPSSPLPPVPLSLLISFCSR